MVLGLAGAITACLPVCCGFTLATTEKVVRGEASSIARLRSWLALAIAKAMELLLIRLQTLVGPTQGSSSLTLIRAGFRDMLAGGDPIVSAGVVAGRVSTSITTWNIATAGTLDSTLFRVVYALSLAVIGSINAPTTSI